MSHDLGNLLQVVSSVVRLIDRNLDEPTRAAMRPLTESALASVDKAAALSRDILNLTRPGADVADVTFPADILTAMQDMICLAAGPAIEVEFDCDDGVPAVACSGRALENAVLNLVINARAAMLSGGRLTLSVSVQSHTLESRGGAPVSDATVVISVRDTGVGMSEATAKQVFRPFFTTKPPGRGGLGLTMVGDFVRRAGGSVLLSSLEGEGTTVALMMPACPSSASNRAQP